MTTPTDTVATFTEGAKAGRKLIRGTKGADVQLSVDWGYVKITAPQMNTARMLLYLYTLRSYGRKKLSR